MATILVVDDEMGIRELLSEILEDEGHEIVLAENAAAARKALPHCEPALVLLDIWMPDTDGLTLLKEWVAAGALRCPVVMMSGHATIDTAVEATGLGAMDFLEKPIAMHRLLASVHKALARGALAAPALPSAPLVLDTPQGLDAAHSALAIGDDPSSPTGNPTAHTAPLDPWQHALSALDLNQPLRDVRDQFETIYFNHLLAKENWAITRVAEACGLERTHLYRKLKALNIEIARHGKHADAADSSTDAPQ
jgi:DNA-binding NtrC family response regulator